MQRLLWCLCVITAVFSISAQDIQHEAVAINIEVPVRVFKSDLFIDTLTIDDFEVYEDGVLQEIEAFYLIKKTVIEREDVHEGSTQRFIPQVSSRYFVLLFDILTFLPKVEQALELFFERVFLPEDRLMIITAMNVYNLKENSWKVEDRGELYEHFKGIIRKDAVIGNAEYRNNLKSLERLASQLSDLRLGAADFESDEDRIDMILGRYTTMLRKMETIRVVDQKKLIQFAHELGNREGQKTVFLFYQREFIPQPHPKIILSYQQMFQTRQDILFKLNDVFDFYRRDMNFDAEKIKQAYSDSSVSIHFLFLTKLPDDPAHGIYYREQSEDIFSAFYQLAQATGGYTIASANALPAFKKVVDASENYYLLYYIPKDYKSDGKFRNIKVKVKGKKYRVLHRAGYLAD
jgi:VWFA-related protein